MKITKKGTPKNRWTQEEDQQLRELVGKYGPERWAFIAIGIENRSGKQCRERWTKYLDPKFNRGPYTKDEDHLLIEKYKKYGSQWSKMTEFFDKRNDVSLKNRWQFLKKNINFEHLKDFNTSPEENFNFDDFFDLGIPKDSDIFDVFNDS